MVLRTFIVFCRGGQCGLFGEGGLIMFDVNSVNPSYRIADLLAVLVLGMIGGIFGSLYNYLVDKVLRTYSIINEYVLEIPFILMSLRLVIFVPVISSVLRTHMHTSTLH